MTDRETTAPAPVEVAPVKKKRGRNQRLYSLRVRLLVFMLLGLVIAVGVYVVLRTSLIGLVDHYYITDHNKNRREENYIESLQEYIKEQGLSTGDTAQISRWARRNRYVYLLIYRDDELLFSTDQSRPEGDLIGSGGITVELPKAEELFQYAEENDLYTLILSDGVLFASLAEFSEYLYYELINIGSLLACALVLTLIMYLYYHSIANRISRLATDVGTVSQGDMNHPIRTDGEGDEISALCENVENMRGAVLDTLQKERAALNMNSELITSLSHDIRTPLTVLLGYLDVMKLHAEGDETMLGYLKTTEDTAHRLKELSDDMFRYSLAFDTRELDLSLRPYGAVMLMEQMLGEHILLLTEAGYLLSYDPAYADAVADKCVLVDPAFLMRIVDNIFTNIKKYADKNFPINISLTCDNEKLSLQFVNKIDHSASKVKSTGIGLKNCHRLANEMHLTFRTEAVGGSFYTTLLLPVHTPAEGEGGLP